jgi:elongation factor Ts
MTLADITIEMVKELRQKTGAGVMDAKHALEEAGGDMDAAVRILREKGLETAASREDRATSQGTVVSYIHGGGRIGALVELNCETDFVANTDGFRDLARDIAMQVAAMSPLVVSVEDRTDDMEGPDEQVCLLSQPFIRDGATTIGDMIQDSIAETRENIRVHRFARYELGT